MRYLILFCWIFSCGAIANIFNQTAEASNVKVITPSILEFTTTINHSIPSGKLRIKIKDIDFNGKSNVECKLFKLEDCDKLSSLLSDAKIQINLKKYDHEKAVFIGDVFINGENLVYKLIKEGWYKFDYRQSRNKYYVLLQKHAMCNGLGIWQGYSSTIDYACN